MKRTRGSMWRKPRRGLTLVELVVAMTVMSVGLLAIVGASAKVAGELGAARRNSLGSQVALTRFEEIAGTACSSITREVVTQSTTRGVTERWKVSDGANNTLSIIDSVSWTNGKTTRRRVFFSLLPCRPGA
jgi:prepilin-type N-terminal cleavage/methylation domain-containing protein